MFHAISQTAGLVLTPTNALVILILLGATVGLVRRAAWARGLTVAASLALGLLALLPFGDWFLTPLESRFPPFTPDRGPVAGIIVLGGSVSTAGPQGEERSEPNQAVDRLFVASHLARHFPAARVVVSGGPVESTTHASEADAVAGYLLELGLAPSRLIEERRSKDTFENARFSAALLHPRPGQRWLLVTSAAHMPRAVGCFRAAGFKVTAAPADWRANPAPKLSGWAASSNLAKVDLAFKEYMGLLAYRLRGRATELFPGP